MTVVAMYARPWMQGFSLLLAVTLGPVHVAHGADFLRPPPPDNAPPLQLFSYGFELLQRGHAVEAIPFFLRGLETDRDNYLAHFHLAQSYRRAGRAADAAQHYRRVVLLNPTSREAEFSRRLLAMLAEDVGSDAGGEAAPPR